MGEFRPHADELVANNARFAAGFDDGDRPAAPARNLAIVACMDARVDVVALLGLDHGDAHVIRNAGGVITDDVIRSLCLSQRKLGTREVILLHHTACGLQTITDDAFKAELGLELGVKPPWSVESFSDPFADTRQSMRRIATSAFLPHRDHVRGFVYDVGSGMLHEVEPDGG